MIPRWRRTGTPRAEAAALKAESAGPDTAGETGLLAESKRRRAAATCFTTASPWGSGSADRLPAPCGPDPLVFGPIYPQREPPRDPDTRWCPCGVSWDASQDGALECWCCGQAVTG